MGVYKEREIYICIYTQLSACKYLKMYDVCIYIYMYIDRSN